MKSKLIVQTLAAAALVTGMTQSTLAQQDGLVTAETLLDRIQIEDFLTRYYYDLSSGKAHELAEYFTTDAVLDVDSTIRLAFWAAVPFSLVFAGLLGLLIERVIIRPFARAPMVTNIIATMYGSLTVSPFRSSAHPWHRADRTSRQTRAPW